MKNEHDDFLPDEDNPNGRFYEYTEEDAKLEAAAGKKRKAFVTALSKLKTNEGISASIETVFKYLYCQFSPDLKLTASLPEAEQKYLKKYSPCEAFERAFADLAGIPAWCPKLKARVLRVNDWAALERKESAAALSSVFSAGKIWADARAACANPFESDCSVISEEFSELRFTLALRKRGFDRLHFIPREEQELLRLCVLKKAPKLSRIWFPAASDMELPLRAIWDLARDQKHAGTRFYMHAGIEGGLLSFAAALNYATRSYMTEQPLNSDLKVTEGEAPGAESFDLIAGDLPAFSPLEDRLSDHGGLDPEYALFAKILSRLSDGGTALLGVSCEFARRLGAPESAVRQKLLRAGSLKAVIRLPVKLGDLCKARLLLLFDKAFAGDGKVLMVNVPKEYGERTDGSSFATGDFECTLQKILAMADERAEESGVSALVDIREIAKAKNAIDPELFVRKEGGLKRRPPEEVLGLIKDQERMLADIRREVEEVRSEFRRLDTRYQPLRL
ncbi:MAG: N-6 DNA methylase [Succinivibrio sp.]|nr:N-6 DNA methylase [Succinivibrio sp.]